MPEFHIDVTDTSIVAPELLKQCSGLSKQQLKQAMKKGAVWVSDADSGYKRLRRADKALKVGQQLHLYYDANVLLLSAMRWRGVYVLSAHSSIPKADPASLVPLHQRQQHRRPRL